MIKNKSLITAIILSSLVLFPICADAGSAHSLLKMDVKRSGAADTVDVTFYTTGNSTNSLVTRKSENRYVVLLPNTQGTASVVPNLGGVKDLISNVDVKSVDDGIGGYTKVTFSTTKPVKIQTYTKKTEPLTKAQEEYKNLIAKHESVPAIRTGKTTTSTPAAAKSTAPAVKTPTQQNVASTVAKVVQASTSVSASKTNTTKPEAKVTPAQNKTTQTKPVKQETPVKTTQVKPKETPAAAATKPVEAVKPKVNVPEEVQTVNTVKPAETKPVEEAKPVENAPVEEVHTNISSAHAGALGELETFGLNKSKLKKIPIIGVLVVLGLFIFAAIFNVLVKMAAKSSQEFRKLFDTPVARPEGIDKEKLKSIMNDESLNWQEKYKRYTQTEDQVKSNNGYTFVTDMSGKKDAVVSDNGTKKTLSKKKNRVYPNKETRLVTKPINNEELKARISQMEHALSQTPSMNTQFVQNNNSVKSEESAISQKMSSVKLKSFARSRSLREASRNLYNEFKQETSNGQYKEGRFVKLKNSPLSVNSRKSKGIDSASDVINADEQMVTVSQKAKDDAAYTSSSLGEYFAILDSEPSEQIANSFQKHSSDMRLGSNSTNPISSSRPNNPYGNFTSDYMSMENMDIKSTYTIDSQRSIHLVNVDGHSALIGKNGSNISLIKNFETSVYKPLQVRRDYNSVYIVRVGEFKCLVDSAAPKMGVLLEI